MRYILALPVLLFCVYGCGMQGSYDYEPQRADNHVYVDTWDYIVQRQDVFSMLKQTIELCGLQELYTQGDKPYTYLLWDNTAFTRSGGILAKYANGGGIESLDAEAVTNALLYHIVDGYYHGLGTLTFDPTPVITLWRSQRAMMTLSIAGSTDVYLYSRLLVNDNLGSGQRVVAVTSNLITTNGVIHVLDREAVYTP